MTGKWEIAKKDEQDNYSLSDGNDNPPGPPQGIGHNPIVTDGDMPYLSHEPLPEYPSGYGLHMSLESTLATLTTRPTAWPENSDSPSSAPLSTNGNSLPSATGANDYGSSHDDSESGHGPPMLIAAIMVPIAALAIIGAFIFLCMRKRRKQKEIAAAQAKVQEMKSRSSPTVQAYVASPLPLARPLSQPTSPINLSPMTPTAPQPVILGPISGSNNNYFTGIDTSDIMSVRSNERTGLGDPFADGNSLNEEPPPPYYPRSIAPLSRDASFHWSQPPPVTSSQTELIGTRGPVRSPFDDPREDDAVSDVIGPTARWNREDLSEVSDLSYQQDPVAGRQNV